MKSLLFTAILSLRKRSEQLLIKFAILLQIGLTHAQTFFRGVAEIWFRFMLKRETVSGDDLWAHYPRFSVLASLNIMPPTHKSSDIKSSGGRTAFLAGGRGCD
jgi:hypothetical protein